MTFSFLEGKFIRTIAIKIRLIPTHWIRFTFSFNKTKAIETETGSSKDEMILPNPKPVFGKPKLNSIGGRMVPKSAKIKP